MIDVPAVQSASTPRGMRIPSPLRRHLADAAARKSGVRPATEADIDEMVAMLRIQFAASALRDISFHEPKVRAVFRHAIAAQDHTCFVYERAQGGLAGMMVGFITQHFFSLETMASDLFVFVRPEARGSIAAARLWSAFRDWARAAGASTLCFGTIGGEAPERTRRFYTGLGMTEVGSLYLQPLSKAGSAA
jgi:hypothetical protein